MLCRTAAPPSLPVTDEETSLALEKMPAASSAPTSTAPVAVTVDPVTPASAELATLLDTSTPPIALPAAPKSAEAAESAMFDTVALICAALRAATLTAPALSTVEFSISARLLAGWMPLKAFEISGSPISASTRLKSRLDGFQPTVLKAIAKPTPVSPVESAVCRRASIAEVLSADTATAPLIALLLIRAVAELRTRLVVTWALTASTVPEPQADPPDAVTSVSTAASIVAASVAVTLSEAAAAVASSRTALTTERASLTTTRPPTARASEFDRLPRFGHRLAMSPSLPTSLTHGPAA